jgi:hypothetical protein
MVEDGGQVPKMAAAAAAITEWPSAIEGKGAAAATAATFTAAAPAVMTSSVTAPPAWLMVVVQLNGAGSCLLGSEKGNSCLRLVIMHVHHS